MIINKNIEIVISYKIQNDDWQSIKIEPRDYFDGNNYGVDEEEFEIDIDSLPLFDNAIDYIILDDKGKKNISYTKLSVTDIDSKEKKTIKESYWNNQKNICAERVDFNSDGSVDYHEIIITSLVQDDPDEAVLEIMRFPKKDDLFTPAFHSFITEDQKWMIFESVILPEKRLTIPVRTSELLKKAPRKLEQMKKRGQISDKTLAQLKKLKKLLREKEKSEEEKKNK